MINPAKMIKVLVVDDSFLMRSILKSILQKDERITVVAEAADGEEALSLLETLGPVDVILLDIEMPRMDGLQFMASPRLTSTASIVVVSSVAKLDSPKAKEALALGAKEILQKPSGILSVDLKEANSREILNCIYRQLAC